MKTNAKLKIRGMDDHRLIKRYNYLKSKNKSGEPTNQMKYLLFHIRKRGLKV